eukprot:TRINITY_DN28516_c0_g1_i1.p1 TRINITY_DN28516_c0_g1~~TRINITY_DN28516_c0_g1_i1.p1  ORF type:complete len:266 (-),score=63.02 TRINITY_DN28516_c0_g1_i1:471-1268(-)
MAGVAKAVVQCQAQVKQLTQRQTGSNQQLEQLLDHHTELKATFTQLLVSLQGSVEAEQAQETRLQTDYQILQASHAELQRSHSNLAHRMDGVAEQLVAEQKKHAASLVLAEKWYKEQLQQSVQQMSADKEMLLERIVLLENKLESDRAEHAADLPALLTLQAQVQIAVEEQHAVTNRMHARAADTAMQVCEQVGQVIERHGIGLLRRKVETIEQLLAVRQGDAVAGAGTPDYGHVHSSRDVSFQSAGESKLCELLQGLGDTKRPL